MKLFSLLLITFTNAAQIACPKGRIDVKDVANGVTSATLPLETCPGDFDHDDSDPDRAECQVDVEFRKLEHGAGYQTVAMNYYCSTSQACTDNIAQHFVPGDHKWDQCIADGIADKPRPRNPFSRCHFCTATPANMISFAPTANSDW